MNAQVLRGAGLASASEFPVWSWYVPAANEPASSWLCVLTHGPALLEHHLADLNGGFMLNLACSLIKGQDSVVTIEQILVLLPCCLNNLALNKKYSY